jgi:hypothetical protein
MLVGLLLAYSAPRAQNLTLASNTQWGKAQSDVPLSTFLDQLKGHYNVNFGYDASLLQHLLVRKPQPPTDNLEADLKKVLSPLGLEFEKIRADQYVITAKRRKSAPESLHKKEPSASTNHAGTMENIGKAQGKSIFDMSSKDAQQGNVVSGKVTAADNEEPLPGVNIIVKGTTSGVVTDLDGNYRLQVESDNAVLYSARWATTKKR